MKVDTSTLDNKQKLTFDQINTKADKYKSSQQPVNLNTNMLQNIQTQVLAFVGNCHMILLHLIVFKKSSLKLNTGTLNNTQKYTFNQLNNKIQKHLTNCERKMLLSLQSQVFTFVSCLPHHLLCPRWRHSDLMVSAHASVWRLTGKLCCISNKDTLLSSPRCINGY